MGMHKAARADALRELSQDFAAGRITEAQYEALAAQLDQLARPPAPMHPTPGPALERRPGHAPAARLPFPRRPQRCQDPEKRRRWAASGFLPPKVAASFSAGEQAALAVVGSWCSIHGTFAWSHARLAAVAGVSVTTARNALRHARRLGLIACGERRASPYRHRPNVVQVISREWSAWLRFRGRQGVKKLPADNTGLEKDGFSRGGVASATAPGLDSQAPRDRRKCESPSPTRKTPSV
jgi:hypothetical protein